MESRRLLRIEIWVFDAPWPVSPGPDQAGNCRYGLLKLTCPAGHSWSQGLLWEEKRVDLIQWSSFLRSIRRCRLEEAIQIVDRLGPRWEQSQRNLVSNALLHLKAKLQGKFIDTPVQTDYSYYHSVLAAGGNSSAGRMYYRPSRTLQLQQAWPEPDPAELINKSIAYYSIL
ncbi:hypothetical protein [Paenibacillus graminis]|uniref:hypothetical protein n=1 Tax=Paenibacillus graminis TaxID=189425 RepID=UPI002DBEC678|nr:hypothetical protein [Paenibacillus graminis]MEC0170150.1 hypothetical protein [Paenibacillus graminis]